MAIRRRLPISPMFGHFPATWPRAIRTGSWLAPKARTSGGDSRRAAVARYAVAAVIFFSPCTVDAARRQLPYPERAWPLEIPGGQYEPIGWADISGWNDDDQLQAF